MTHIGQKLAFCFIRDFRRLTLSFRFFLLFACRNIDYGTFVIEKGSLLISDRPRGERSRDDAPVFSVKSGFKVGDPVVAGQGFLESSPAFGFDIASNPTCLKAINEGFNTAKLAATGRITLVQETGNQFGVLLLLPIYRKGVSWKTRQERLKNRKGFALEPGFKILQKMADVDHPQDELFIMAIHLDDRFKYVIHHSVNVAVYALKMAEALGFNQKQKLEVAMAALLHDAGWPSFRTKYCTNRRN